MAAEDLLRARSGGYRTILLLWGSAAWPQADFLFKSDEPFGIDQVAALMSAESENLASKGDLLVNAPPQPP
jgi:hypothetical protein